MIAATLAIQRPSDARLLAVDMFGSFAHYRRSALTDLLRKDDVLIANDAATLPASLSGTHSRTGRAIEIRLAGQKSLSPGRISSFTAVVFGEGDFHTPTENRPSPPELRLGDSVQFGSFTATIVQLLDHPRLVSLQFEGSAAEIWQGLARAGRPIQYSYISTQLEIWDTWPPIAAVPAAFEAPSASFIIDWRFVRTLAERGVKFATLTHAAGISSIGDPSLDSLLPFPEPYRIPQQTAELVEGTRTGGGRVIAVGTSVVRALEHVFSLFGAVRAGQGLATQRIGPDTPLGVVDAIISGTHEPETSHYELLRSFVDARLLRKITTELTVYGYRTHEFGDSVFIERSKPPVPCLASVARFENYTSAHNHRSLCPTF